MAAAAKAARRNTTMHMNDFYLPNDPFQDPCIGRRTGVTLKIQARKDSLGFDNIDDYFPDSDPEEENIIPNVQSSDKDFVGRRTGMSFNINPRKDSKGFDNVDDYFPDSGAGKSEESSPIEGQPADTIAQDNQVEAESPEENTCDATDELQTADTPEGTPMGESPNDTGTLIKHVSSHQASPQVEGPIKKRLSFSHGRTPAEPELDKQRMTRGPQDRKDTKAISEEDDNNDSEIIVVDIGDDTQPEHEGASTSHLPTAIKTKEKAGKQKVTNAKQIKNHRNITDDDEEVIDIEGIDGEETFLTIGNTTQIAKSIDVDKSPIDVEAERFVMSESFVLEGTRHKTMSPEYVSCSDSQPELHDSPATKGKKSKIPVRKNGMTMSAKPKATRGRPKKVEKSQNEELAAGEALYNEEGDSEVGEGDGDGDDEIEGGSSNSKHEQSKSLRGRKQNTKQRLRATQGGQKKVEESKIQEAEEDLGNDNGEDEGDEGMSSSNSKQEQSKSLRSTKQNTKQRATRGGQKKVEESKIDEAEDLGNDSGDDEGDEGMSSSNSKQEQSKSLRSTKQNTKQRATRGGQKKVEESKIDEAEDLGNDSGDDEGDEGMSSSNSKQEQSKSLRSTKQNTKQRATRGGQKKVEESNIEEAEEDLGNDSGDDEGMSSLNSKREQSKSLRRRRQNTKQRAALGGQKKVEESKIKEAEEDLGNDSGDDEGDEGMSYLNSKQEQSKSFRRRRQNAKHRASPGGQKKVEESEIEEPEAREDLGNDSGEDESDERMRKSSRGHKQKIEEVKLVESEAVEVNDGDAKSLPGTKQQQKSTRKAKLVAVVSDEELHHGGGNKSDDIDDDQEQKRGKGRRSVPNIKQQQKRMPRGRKQKSNENKEGEVNEGDNMEAEVDEEKPAGPKSRTMKGVEDSRKQKQTKRKNVAEVKDQAKEAELSGRKTRAQRRKEADVKINRKVGNGEEEGKIEVGVVDVEVEDVENENVASEETGQEEGDQAELGGRKTRAQRRKVADAKINRKDGNGEEEGKIVVGVVDVDIEDVENENVASEETGQEEEDKAELGGRKTRAQRKKQAVTKLDKKDGNREEGGEEVGVVDSDVEDVAEDENVASEDTGQEKEESEGDDTVVENNSAQELNNVQTSTNKSGEESVSNISNISSNASSSSESKKKNGSGGGTKRRKRTSILPPYAAKRRRNKANSSKTSVTVNSHDNTTESEPTIEAKKPRLDETLTKKGDRKGGRAARTGRKSGGRNKSVKERNKTKDSDGTRAKSGSAMQNADDNEGEDVTVSGEVHEVFEEGDGNYSVEEAGGVEGRSFEEVPSENMSPTPIPRPTKTATTLKSILKSGGSVGRATAVSRKRQINTDKSHSGGSDADDESVLPAKQPNRQRLSTVSFASNPFGQASPQGLTPSVASKHSPVGDLSFLSKDSSYRFTDGTFTPGSAQTVRSSVGSASGASSIDDTVIDPEEEVSITNDTKQLGDTSDEHSTRRSKRTIVPPLQYWKNERIDYERRKSGGWCVKGVIKNPTPTPKLRRKSKKDKKPVVKQEKHVNAADSSEEELDNIPQEELDGFKEVTNPTGIVLNPENNEEVHMDIFHVPGMLNFTNPSGKPSTDDDPLVVHKFISQPFFGGGQVILKPGAEKGRQFVRNDTMVFYVIKGRIMVTIHQSSVVLSTGATFFVPQGNSYNIKNLKQTDAKLMFVQIKG